MEQVAAQYPRRAAQRILGPGGFGVVDQMTLAIAERIVWQQVPELVAVRYKQAADVKRTLRKVIKHLPVADTGYGHVYWNPETKTAWAVLSDSDDDQTYQKWENALRAISGVDNVKLEAEYGPHGDDAWIRIKGAAALEWLNMPYQAAGKLTGGPSPMSNAIVSGLLGGGLGYGAGVLAENLLPSKYVDKGKLRKRLALLGGLGAAGAHGIPQAIVNNRMSHTAGKPLGLRAAITPNEGVPMAPHELDLRNAYHNKTGEYRLPGITLPRPPDIQLRSSHGFVKAAFMDSGVTGSMGVPLEPIPVDGFNRAIWRDNQNPAYINAAAAGLVSGVSQVYGGTKVLSPRHIIHGFANAGLDAATAKIAGGVLGALGILNPAGQEKLQDMGIWAGLIRGVTGSVLGLK